MTQCMTLRTRPARPAGRSQSVVLVRAELTLSVVNRIQKDRDFKKFLWAVAFEAATRISSSGPPSHRHTVTPSLLPVLGFPMFGGVTVSKGTLALHQRPPLPAGLYLAQRKCCRQQRTVSTCGLFGTKAKEEEKAETAQASAPIPQRWGFCSPASVIRSLETHWLKKLCCVAPQVVSSTSLVLFP